MTNWLARTFASAIVRRCAYLLVALLIAQLAMCGKAHATTYSEAYAACTAGGDYSCHDNGPTQCLGSHSALSNGSGQVCGQASWCAGGTGNCVAFSYSYAPCPTGYFYSTGSHACLKDCANTPAPTGYAQIGWGQSICSGGCSFAPPADAINTCMVIDGKNYCPTNGYQGSSEGACATGGDNGGPKPDTPVLGSLPSDADGDGASDGNDPFPNDPSNGSDGSKPPPACGGSGQPACGAGDEKDNQASGGGDCNSPPVCSGDGIACNTNFQTFKTRCAAASAAALLQASNDKLQAIKDLTAAQATAAKQDDLKAEIALSRAQLSSLATSQLAEQQASRVAAQEQANAALQEQYVHRDEINATNTAIADFKDKMVAEQEATKAVMQAIHDKYAAEVAVEQQKIEDLKGLTMDQLQQGDRAHDDATLQIDNQAVLKDAIDTYNNVAHNDAVAQKAALDVANAKLQSLVDKDTSVTVQGTDMSATNGTLRDILNALADFGAAPNLDGIQGVLNAIHGDMTDGAGIPGHDATGEDVTADGAVVDGPDIGGPGGLDHSGFGWGVSCSAPPTVSVFGHEIAFQTNALCMWMSAAGWFVLLLASLGAAKIIAGGFN